MGKVPFKMAALNFLPYLLGKPPLENSNSARFQYFVHVLSLSNTVLVQVVFEHGIANRKPMRGEVVIRGFLWIRVLDWLDRLSEQASKYGRSIGHSGWCHLN